MEIGKFIQCFFSLFYLRFVGHVGWKAAAGLAVTHRSKALSSMTLSLSVSQDVCPCMLKNALQPDGGGSLDAIYMDKQHITH